MVYYDDQDDAAADDRELPDVADMDQDEGDEQSETVRCPYCRKRVYEQAEECPYCGSYISSEDASPHTPVWIIVGAIVCLAVVILLWLR